MSFNIQVSSFTSPTFSVGPLVLTPPLPQGTSLINPAIFDNLISELNSIDACAFAQEAMNRAMAVVQEHYNALINKLLQLEIVKLLLSIPKTLQDIINWITNLITFLIKPYYQAYVDGIATIALVTEKAGELVNAFTSLEQRLTHCQLTIPSFSPLPGVNFTP